VDTNPRDREGLIQVLRHPKVMVASNLYSVIFDFRNNTLLLSSGKLPAAKYEYREYPLF
jgi:hypothetical protein